MKVSSVREGGERVEMDNNFPQINYTTVQRGRIEKENKNDE